MEYRLELGAWGSVFAVPTAVVDEHLRLAGGAQLKVMLYILRHAGEGFTAESIGQALSMHQADVSDCVQYWINAGLLSSQEGILTPPQPEAALQEEAEPAADTMTDIPAPVQEKQPKRLPSRPEKPDAKYLSERIRTDPAVEFLMNSADEIFGRLTSVNDKETLLLIHEYDGLPVEVLIMLMQYAAGEGKCNMRYIEKLAISWAEEEIFTLEAAEKKIKELSERTSAAKRYQRIIGLEAHSPTKKEKDFADLWLNKRRYPEELIREAYEICIDNKGKYIQKYIGSILESWFKAGIGSVEQLKAQQSVKKTKASKDSYGDTFDLSLYESMRLPDEEGWGQD